MPSNTLRYKSGDARLSATVYWRRRFVALLAGLAVFGILGWALSGAVGGGGTGSNAADVGRVGHAHAGAATTGPGASSGPGTSPSAHPASQAGAAPATAAQSLAKSPGPGRPAQAGPASCPPGDVVISLFAVQASYGQGLPAQFDVDVVSTAAGRCSFNIGPRYLAVVVTAGKQRVWGSADCAAAPGSLATELARGVPVVLPLSWYLQTSAPGCPAPARQAAGGSYTATAAGSGVTSNPVTFKLG